MKLSLNWLKDYIDIEMTPQALAHLLTMAGLEVEGMVQVGHGLEDIMAARILGVSPHPNADRLHVCEVDAGGNTWQVVCGAPNIQVGAMVPFAPEGAKLPDGRAIKAGKFRGVMSKGMLLAEDEMGLTDDHTGLMILPDDFPLGVPVSSAPIGPNAFMLSDWVLDLSITPNRPDWTSVLGVAREIAAITRQEIRRPDISLQEGDDTPIETLSSVTIQDTDACPRYTAGLIQGVKLDKSPFWMRYRLFLSEIRSINNIVDVTNYVLMETGQPLHAFDFHRLKENRIVVRCAQEGERFTTLDNEIRRLNPENLMICDAERPVALAGVMGGLNSEIWDETTDVLLESAFFDPVTIRRSSKHIGLSTEASYRFERGADIEGTVVALKRALSLFSRLAGGKIARGIIDAYPKPFVAPHILLHVDRTNRTLGTEIPGPVMADHLMALGMGVQGRDESVFQVTPPGFRVDITREIDLVEEVARLYGYDNVPVTFPSIRPVQESESPDLVLRERVREIMVGLGFSEIITYGFISPDAVAVLGAEKNSPLHSFVNIVNPLTVDQSAMRTSLIPGILSTVQNNVAYGEKDLKLFEWGKVFFAQAGEALPREKTYLAGVMTGFCEPKTWYGLQRKTDFYDIKGALEVLLSDLGLRDAVFRKKEDFPGYDPGHTAGIFYEDLLIGLVGRASSRVLAACDFKEDLYLFEVDIRALLEKSAGTKKFTPFARFPAVYRDISLLVDCKTATDTVIAIARQTAGPLLESIDIYDLYEGERLGPSEKAMTFRLCYRSKEGTLDGEKTNKLHESVIQKIRQETGGKLREG